jgi:nucleoside-diphosphate-sugar epimerase
MAPWLFVKAILAGEAHRVFNHGRMMRDFTYIDDIVEGVIRCARQARHGRPAFDRCLSGRSRHQDRCHPRPRFQRPCFAGGR